MGIILRIDVNTIHICIVKVCDIAEVILINLPFSVLHHLNTARIILLQIGGIFTSSRKELFVDEFHFKEVITIRTARTERIYDCFVFLQILIFIIGRQVCRIFGMRGHIGICHLSLLHVYLHIAKRTVQPGIDTVDSNLVDGFVVCHCLVIERRDIGNIA